MKARLHPRPYPCCACWILCWHLLSGLEHIMGGCTPKSLNKDAKVGVEHRRFSHSLFLPAMLNVLRNLHTSAWATRQSHTRYWRSTTGDDLAADKGRFGAAINCDHQWLPCHTLLSPHSAEYHVSTLLSRTNLIPTLRSVGRPIPAPCSVGPASYHTLLSRTSLIPPLSSVGGDECTVRALSGNSTAFTP